ncbi:hypothetical protein TURU_167339 [Turdus rufiventris]|nr:hypothetical protein TURU_167339 [Turdus rufiventris]
MVALGAVVVFSHRLDSMISEVFSNLIDSRKEQSSVTALQGRFLWLMIVPGPSALATVKQGPVLQLLPERPTLLCRASVTSCHAFCSCITWLALSAGAEPQCLTLEAAKAGACLSVPTAYGDTVTIGDVSFKLKTPKNPELVPQNYMTESLSQSVVHHLRWIMQKDLLGQDVFLIGPPGPLRRSIAMQYLELTKREVEYIALSRDTTETDLKQRREIRGGSAFYLDQASCSHTPPSRYSQVV